MNKLWCVSALALLASSQLIAEPSSMEAKYAGMDEVVREFASTCLMHAFSHEDLHAKLDNSPTALRYNDTQARAFLAGTTGAVWGVRGHASNYAIVLTNNGICSVDAQSHVDGTWQDFDELLKVLFPNATLKPVSQEIAGPSTDQVQSKGFRLESNGKLLPPIFTITTSTDPTINFAERLTVYVPAPSTTK
jgi:hypothetical protein